jgi:DNA polymerase III alpha subunit (gram-positive type)
MKKSFASLANQIDATAIFVIFATFLARAAKVARKTVAISSASGFQFRTDSIMAPFPLPPGSGESFAVSHLFPVANGQARQAPVLLHQASYHLG